MGERPTLLVTTRLGVRPLGVRGEPLHAVAGQLLAVIRRRLGPETADLLADPQLRESGDGIDWYAQRDGEWRALGLAAPARRALINAGLTTASGLAGWSYADIAGLHGIGKNALAILRPLLRD